MSTQFSAEPGASGKRRPAPVVRGEDTLPPVPGSQADGDPVITEAQRKRAAAEAGAVAGVEIDAAADERGEAILSALYDYAEQIAP